MADESGGAHELMLHGGASLGPGVVGSHSLSLRGRGQFAAAAGPVVDTTGSFTVCAWVNLLNTNGFQTFVSQDGSTISGFYLQLLGTSHRFAFARVAADSAHSQGTIDTSPILPQPGEWYHLAGVYDGSKHRMSLYVNGKLQDVQRFVATWRANGPFAVGRAKFNGAPTDFVSGQIDDVRAYSGALSPAQISQLAGPGMLRVDAGGAGPAIDRTEFGSSLEEFNHSGDGGLYAELIRNRDLKESSNSPLVWSAAPGQTRDTPIGGIWTGSPPAWTAVADGGSEAAIDLDGTEALNRANPVSLKLSIGTVVKGGRVGVANTGYWGIPVRPSTAYHVSFFAKGVTPTSAPLTVSIESDTGAAYASATVMSVSNHWARYRATLTTSSSAPTSDTNRLVISTDSPSVSGSTLWFAFVSLFGPTYDAHANGFRVDLMDKLAALRPGYLRIPGGNYLEGSTTDTRFDWSQTIGPIEDRPGHFNSAWGYWSQDGLGLLEYLEMAEQLHAQPLLAVYAGYSLDGSVVARSRLAPYVRDALDEIQYAIGPTSTTWGARRAADGHPAPFDVRMVEIGNEDEYDSSGSYNAYRYPMFYDAIKAAYPDLKIVATTPVASRPIDIIDNHYYTLDPAFLESSGHLFDSTSRAGPKIIVGEYAVSQGEPTGTLAAALGESAFLTGIERNADLVIGSSYAPVLVNVKAQSLSTSMIGYNALNSYGSPSYWAQTMFAAGHGDHVVSSQLIGGSGTLFDVASHSPGHSYVVVVNGGAEAAPTNVSLSGVGVVKGGTVTVLTGDPTAMNSLARPTAVVPQTSALGHRGGSFAHTFPAYSLTVLDLRTR